MSDTTTTAIDIPRPTSGDVLERILQDHRLFEDLLRQDRAITEHEEEHGEEYDDALEDLATVVNHHSNEEEQTILNPAREDVSVEERERLGTAWLARRNELLEQGCASPEQVAALLDEAAKQD